MLQICSKYAANMQQICSYLLITNEPILNWLRHDQLSTRNQPWRAWSCISMKKRICSNDAANMQQICSNGKKFWWSPILYQFVTPKKPYSQIFMLYKKKSPPTLYRHMKTGLLLKRCVSCVVSKFGDLLWESGTFYGTEKRVWDI